MIKSNKEEFAVYTTGTCLDLVLLWSMLLLEVLQLPSMRMINNLKVYTGKSYTPAVQYCGQDSTGSECTVSCLLTSSPGLDQVVGMTSPRVFT
jgi:hypothetical protein